MGNISSLWFSLVGYIDVMFLNEHIQSSLYLVRTDTFKLSSLFHVQIVTHSIQDELSKDSAQRHFKYVKVMLLIKLILIHGAFRFHSDFSSNIFTKSANVINHIQTNILNTQ